MRIRILGAGIYGAHLGVVLSRDGHDVEIHEIASRAFSGASGNIPARLHQGQHYPRSKLTRVACQKHYTEFMTHYGDFTSGVPINLYCIAEHDSLLDFGTYCQILNGEIEFITVERPSEFGLKNIEGAILTGERHIIVDRMREYFTTMLGNQLKLNIQPGVIDDPLWDLTIDATFCAYEGFGIDRFEACLTILIQGRSDKAVTIVDGGFSSIYPWDEEASLCSLTSAKYTPLTRCATWRDARYYIDHKLSGEMLRYQTEAMITQMSKYYPAIHEYKVMDHRLAIRALPRSAADARLIDIIRVGERAIRIRSGKLDAIFEAERIVKKIISCKREEIHHNDRHTWYT